MIISMQTSDLSTKAIAALKTNNNENVCYDYYEDERFVGREDTQAYIIDLEADGDFQDSFSPEILAQRLKQKGLSESINTINLLVSDVCCLNTGKMSFYGAAFNAALQKEFNRDITVKIISDLNYPITLVSPPESEGKDWQVFGIKAEDALSLPEPEPNVTDFNFYKALPQKELLWEGKNIDEWLNKAENRAIKQTKKLADEGDGVGYVSSHHHFNTAIK